MPEYERVDYTNIYGAIMSFDKNKETPIHQWYPFVEGYASDFIKSIVDELEHKPECCLDIFSGSGTTSLEMQHMGIKCYSFEISPFMYELSRVKLRTDYTLHYFDIKLLKLKEIISNAPFNIENIEKFPKNRNYVEKEGLKKWHYDTEVMRGILDIKYAINLLNDELYSPLFRIALASILLKVSNMYRNGKCISYKKNFDKRQVLSREEVHEYFYERLENVFRLDIENIEKNSMNQTIYNYNNCKQGDTRKLIDTLDDDSIDLLITSPPYLNSRDYTDSYIDELRVLGYMDNISSEQEYRSKTIRSHVQVKWDKKNPLEISLLIDSYNKIKEYEKDFWNNSLLDMISGYFWDMDTIFKSLYSKMKFGGSIYFNVANSAYYETEIEVDKIIAEIAENNGFKVVEIREARRMKPSSQQRKHFDYLIESVIVIKKEPVV